MRYITGIARNNRLEAMAKRWTDDAATRIEAAGKKQRLFASIS